MSPTSSPEIQTRRMVRTAWGDLAKLGYTTDHGRAPVTATSPVYRFTLVVRGEPTLTTSYGGQLGPAWTLFQDNHVRPMMRRKLVTLLATGTRTNAWINHWSKIVQEIERGRASVESVIPAEEDRPIVWDLARALAMFPKGDAPLATDNWRP